MAADTKPSEDPGTTTNMGVDYVISYRFATTGMSFELVNAICTAI